MPCVICGKLEKCAEESKDYACGSCVCRIMGLDSDGRRYLVDQLYLEEKEEAAEFLKCVFFGENKSKQSVLKPRIK